MSDQRPATKIRLKIRTEDYGDEPPIPLLAVVGDGAEAFGGGGAFEVSPSAYATTQDILPKSWRVELNSPRKADTATIVFDLDHFPAEPQVLRSAGVQIFAGVMSSADFARANAYRGSAGYMLPDSVPDGYYGAGQSWEIFRGFVDEWEIDYDAGEIRLTARDTTCFFIDARIPENSLAKVSKDARLSEAIQTIIDDFPGARGTVVVVEAETDPKLSDFAPPTWFSSKGKLAKGRKRKPKAAKEMSFWDQITDLCVAAGLKAYMRQPRKATTLPGIGAVLPAAELVITDAQTYYAGGEGTARRVFAYGINIGGLKITRKFGGAPVPFVEVRSWDRVAGKQVIGRYPPNAAGGVSSGGGGANAIEKEIKKIADAAASAAGAAAVLAGANPVAVAAAEAAARSAILDATPEKQEEVYAAAARAAAVAAGLGPAGVAAAELAARQTFQKKLKPPKARRNKITPTGSGDRQEYEIYTIDSLSGPNAQAKANEIARSLYDQLGRGEFLVRFQTSWVNGIPANFNRETAADMLLMRPAEAIDVYVEPARDGVVVGEDQQVALASEAELVRRFRARGVDVGLATRLAKAMRDPRVQRTFRAQTITVEFDNDAGYTFNIEAINFLDARYEP